MLEKMKHIEISGEQIAELHNLMVQTVIDYLKKNNLNDVDEIHFSADAIQASKDYGEWTPATDSSIELVGIEDGVRKEIGYRM